VLPKQLTDDRRRHAIPETTRCAFISARDGVRREEHCWSIARVAHHRRSNYVCQGDCGVALVSHVGVAPAVCCARVRR
jgi:hypothetical protein